MKLLLVQHGEAFPKDVDPNRGLTKQGIADIERIARFVRDADIAVDRVVHSGKLRASQTAQYLAAASAAGVEMETSDIINPNDNPDAFARQVLALDRDTLVVGHLPFLGKLIAHLVLGDMDRVIAAYKPGSVVCLGRNEDGHWLVEWMVRPELLAG